MAAKLFRIPYTSVVVNGLAVPGAKLYFYQSGTLTLLDVYTTSALNVAHSNPVIANGGGRFADIYADEATPYRLIVKDRNGVTLDDIDPIYFGSTSISLPAAAFSFATRATMAAVTPVAGTSATLIEAGREGTFVFKSAATILSEYGVAATTLVTADPQQGIFVPPTGGTGSTGAWVRKFSGPHVLTWFGSTYAAFAAVQTYFAAIARSGYGYSKATPSVFVPFGLYDFAGNPFDVIYPIRWMAEGTGGSGGGSVVLKWNNTSSGIRVQAADTTGESGIQASAPNRGAETIFDGFYFDGGFAGGDEADRYGLLGRGQATFCNCFWANWAGDAIFMYADSNGAQKGNANGFTFDKCFVQGCRDGFHCSGGDTNAGYTIGLNVISCRRWGISDESFLGNAHYTSRTSSNARTSWNTGAVNRPCSYVSIGGSRYFVIRGQEAWASTNAPKSSTVTITIASPGMVSWASHGIPNGTVVTFATTGALPTGLTANTAYYVVNAGANDFQVSATLGGVAINTSGTQSGTHTSGAGSDNTGWAWFQAGGVAATTGVPAWSNGINIRAGGSYNVSGLSNGTSFFNPYAEGDQASQFDQAAAVFGDEQLATSVRVTAGVLYRNRLASFGSNVDGAVLAGGLQVAGNIAVAGTQVVGPRGAAVANATDAASVITQLNAALARLRAHGLIAP